MAVKLKKSPLPQRIDPPQPRRHWFWTEPGPYHAVLTRNEAALVRLLTHPGRLLRFDDGSYCLIFNDPVTLDPAKTSALPLRRVGPDSYASYQLDGPPPRGVSIIAQGTPRLLQLESATPIDPISLWDFSQMPTHTGRALSRSQTTMPKVGKPRTDSTPKLNEKILSVAGKSKLFEDVKANVAEAPDPRTSLIARATGHFLLRVVASLALIALFCVIILVSVGAIGTVGPFGFLLAVFLLWIFGFFSPRTIDTDKPSARGPARNTRRAQRKSGGVLDRLRGLALWNSPLGNHLRREIQRHLDQVNSMIDRGDIDRALKRAMSLARDEKARQKRNPRLMTTPPKPRAKLDFNLDRDEADTVAIPGDWGFDALRKKYIALAEDLSEQKDHKRAAFIYAELLDMPKKAVAELEQMKAYEEAAKLATARQLDGATIARLWYLAGRKEIALLMARRHNCMEQLAALSGQDVEFSTYVRKHWVEDLVTEGNWPKAVEESADIPQLAATHRDVLTRAVDAGHLRDHPVLERAVQNLHWPIDALNGSSADGVGSELDQLIGQGTTQPDAGELRHALKRAAERMDDGDPRKPALADALVRASLAFDADTPYALTASDLRHFAQGQGCQALAEDLRQVHRAGPTNQKKNLQSHLPRSGHGKWTMVAALHRGAALVGAGTGEVALIDPQGTKRWTDHLPDLVGMVPIGTGRLVLMLQGHETSRRISLLDTARHTYRLLGSTGLVAWDHYAGDGAWQVQTPDAIGSLDLTKLLADTPGFEMLWSITQTIPVKVVAFHRTASSAQWLTQRIDAHGPGLMERWILNQGNLSLAVVLENKQAGEELTNGPHVWCAGQFSKLVSKHANRDAFQFFGFSSTMDAEEQRIAELGADLINRDAFVSVTAVPEGAAYVIEINAPDRSAIRLTHQKTQAVAQIEGHAISAQSAIGDHLAMLTKSGLVILCNFKTMRVLAV